MQTSLSLNFCSSCLLSVLVALAKTAAAVPVRRLKMVVHQYYYFSSFFDVIAVWVELNPDNTPLRPARECPSNW
jgi:hypothetical protein